MKQQITEKTSYFSEDIFIKIMGAKYRLQWMNEHLGGEESEILNLGNCFQMLSVMRRETEKGMDIFKGMYGMKTNFLKTRKINILNVDRSELKKKRGFGG